MSAPVSCGVCGRAVTGDASELLAWSRDGEQWVCPACTREHVRAIEAKLDREWW